MGHVVRNRRRLGKPADGQKAVAHQIPPGLDQFRPPWLPLSQPPASLCGRTGSGFSRRPFASNNGNLSAVSEIGLPVKLRSVGFARARGADMDKPLLQATVAELVGRLGHTKVGALIHRLLIEGLAADSTGINFERATIHLIFPI